LGHNRLDFGVHLPYFDATLNLYPCVLEDEFPRKHDHNRPGTTQNARNHVPRMENPLGVKTDHFRNFFKNFQFSLGFLENPAVDFSIGDGLF
jgi:hypothetical protein